MKTVALLLLLCASAIGQSKTTGTAETKGACSPANTGDKNTFNIKCGIGKEQGDQIIKLLNEILAEHVDPGAVMTVLKNIESQVNTTGVLEPDNRPDPEFPVQTDPLSLNVLLGNNLVSMTGEKCWILSLYGTDVLWIEKSKNGILINARVFGPDKRIVAEIERNDITVNPHNTFKRQIRKHSLNVVDEFEQEVLNVDFVNPRAVVVTGIFYQEDYGKLVVDQKTIIDMKNNHIFRQVISCDGNRTAFAFTPKGLMMGLKRP